MGLLSTAAAQSVTLSWNPSSDATVTSSDATVTGYNVWYASLYDTTVPLTVVNVGNVTQATIPSLAADTYYAFVTSYNAAGTNSNSSNEVVFTVPNPPATVTIPQPAVVATPPGGNFTTADGVWSFGPWYPNGFALLLNGVRVDNGLGAGALLFGASSGVYTVNLQGYWYLWHSDIQRFRPVPAPATM